MTSRAGVLLYCCCRVVSNAIKHSWFQERRLAHLHELPIGDAVSVTVGHLLRVKEVMSAITPLITQVVTLSFVNLLQLNVK